MEIDVSKLGTTATPTIGTATEAKADTKTDTRLECKYPQSLYLKLSNFIPRLLLSYLDSFGKWHFSMELPLDGLNQQGRKLNVKLPKSRTQSSQANSQGMGGTPNKRNSPPHWLNKGWNYLIIRSRGL